MQSHDFVLRVRQSGAQWALTITEISPLDGSTVAVDIQFLDYNK